MWHNYFMNISGIGAYGINLEQLIASQNISNIDSVAQAVQADNAIEDTAEISIAALKMSMQAEQAVAMQLIQGIAELG